MIKLVYCITKKPGLSQKEFSDYWLNVHGPIGARIPGLRKLVQSHVVRNSDEPLAPDFDGMAELWFAGWEELLAARATREWRASTEDEANFIDGSRTAYFVTTEHEIPVSNT